MFYENRLLANIIEAEDSHEISYLIFFFFFELGKIVNFVVCCSCDWCFKDKCFVLFFWVNSGWQFKMFQDFLNCPQII